MTVAVAKKFTIVSVMEFGQQLVDFTGAVKEVKDARVIFECGSYECARPGRQIELARPCWQLVYAFVSLGTDDYKPQLVKDPYYRPQSCEIRYKTWQEEFTLDKGVGADAVNIKNKVPRWEFAGLEPVEDKPFVHPASKRRVLPEIAEQLLFIGEYCA
ncbi:hypothetical protein R1sor_011547 [Riccia sorocarpa]|uniref:Uncharacterized protein n=1 Tax=Riccia sorocarpa TaxID=122646 RepID=A0ABD3I2I3_9MARC